MKVERPKVAPLAQDEALATAPKSAGMPKINKDEIKTKATKAFEKVKNDPRV